MIKMILGAATLAAAFCTAGFGNLLPNGGLTEGDKTPAGWSLSGGQGEWLREHGDGMGCLKVTGSGEDSNAWLSSPVEFLPNRVYRLSFGARGEDAGGGTVVSGPDFANVDLGVPGREWIFRHNVFAAPSRKEGLAVPVRLGQWHLKGSAFFVRPGLDEVEPVHRGVGGLLLGEGERIEASRYYFEAPLDGECRNHSRALAGFTARFNTSRWCFGRGQGVSYRHALAGRRFLSGQVEVTCGYYVSGRLQMEVSADTKEWTAVGAATNTGTQTLALPAEMFPAEAVHVRLRGAGQSCDLQVHAYSFEGDVDGEPLQAKGGTRYVVAESLLPRLRVKVLGLGDALPGGDNFADLRVRNQTGGAFESEARVVFSRPDGAARTNSVAVTLPAGATDVRVPYGTPGVGAWEMTVELGDAFRARGSVTVPDYYDGSYGELLPSGNPQLVLWRASSGWKIPRSRALPHRFAKGVTLRLAGNEREAVQIVVTPAEGLTNVMVKAGALVCGKRSIPAENVSVLRVGYVPVEQKTDSTGVLADWPDPLLPQDAPVTLAAGVNQPYWIRVKAPAGLPAGIYRGEVTVEAAGARSTVPLSAEVFGFSLPDTMTCETAFGFSPGRSVWRYHGVEDPAQRRDVLDKYLRALADNHISPYNPAPMDGWSVKWKGLPQGGGKKGSDKVEAKPETFDINAVEPVFDWAAWDAAMERAFAEYHFNSFQIRVEGLGGGTFHDRYEPSFLGYKGGTPEYDILMGKYLKGIESHLREKGWLDKAYVYWFDEPDPKDYEFVMRGFETLKRHAPGLRRMLTEQVEKGLAGGPNLWCPLTPSLNVDGLEERRAAGDRFWWYVCCAPKAPYATLFIDHPGTEMRVWLWQTWAERVTGILVWETVYWTSRSAYPDSKAWQNPYLDPMSWVSGYDTPEGMKRAWGNGDGRFLYPPLAAADGRPQTPVLDGPVSSFRIEMLRDGLEDYEYFVILKRLLEQKGGKLGARERSRMEALLTVPADVSTGLTLFTRDPAPIEAHRERLARAIVALQRL